MSAPIYPLSFFFLSSPTQFSFLCFASSHVLSFHQIQMYFPLFCRYECTKEQNRTTLYFSVFHGVYLKISSREERAHFCLYSFSFWRVSRYLQQRCMSVGLDLSSSPPFNGNSRGNGPSLLRVSDWGRISDDCVKRKRERERERERDIPGIGEGPQVWVNCCKLLLNSCPDCVTQNKLSNTIPLHESEKQKNIGHEDRQIHNQRGR